jgi:hypothetical protein
METAHLSHSIARLLRVSLLEALVRQLATQLTLQW